jgi:hypothetical protein
MVFPPPGNEENSMDKVLTTPDNLRRNYGIPPEEGRMRALPRWPLAFSPQPETDSTVRLSERERRRLPPKKKDFLGAHFALIMAGVMPAEGDRPNWTPKSETQARLAARLGISRPTFTRRMSRMSNPHGKAAQDPNAQPAHPFFHRERRFGAPNRYEFDAHYVADRASRPQRDYSVAFSHPTVSDLRAHPSSGHLFHGETPAGGYKLVPKWIYDPRLPVSELARLVMTYYFMCGLQEKKECHPKQSTVGARVGLSVRSVRRANAELAAVGLIRVAHPKPVEHPDGRIERGPQIIIYLPGKTLSHEEAQEEFRRLLAAKNGLQAQYRAFWEGIESVHAAILHEWTGKEHRIAAFHRTVREELARRGVPREAIDALIPSQPSD